LSGKDSLVGDTACGPNAATDFAAYFAAGWLRHGTCSLMYDVVRHGYTPFGRREQMRMRPRLLLAAWGFCIAMSAVAYARGTQVEVNRGGVHVEVGANATGTHGAIVRVNDLMGLRVSNSSDESLGKIEDIVIDPSAGTIRYAVVSFGGVLGMGNKLFAVPWQKLTFVPKGTTSSGTEKEAYCLLDLSKDVLKTAPGFDKNNWPDFADRTWNSTINQFYNSQPSTAGRRGMQR
jgi:sporulation protein YlmC with PRC-barrel domain